MPISINGGGASEAPADGVTYGRKDGEWVDITSPANLQVRRGTATEVAAITPLEGEPIWVTDSKHLRVGDGSTAGGIVTPSAVGINRIVAMTEAAYAALAVKDPNTLYVVT